MKTRVESLICTGRNGGVILREDDNDNKYAIFFSWDTHGAAQWCKDNCDYNWVLKENEDFLDFMHKQWLSSLPYASG